MWLVRFRVPGQRIDDRLNHLLGRATTSFHNGMRYFAVERITFRVQLAKTGQRIGHIQ